MSQQTSLSTQQQDGLARVGRVGQLALSKFAAWLTRLKAAARHIHAVLAESPFQGTGHQTRDLLQGGRILSLVIQHGI